MPYRYQKLTKLNNFFEANPRVAIAFSGGVDYSFLLYIAHKCGAQVVAYYVKSAFQPNFEFRNAQHLADSLQVSMHPLEIDVLSAKDIVANRSDRCYHCKKMIFTAISRVALSEGYKIILDGTNASDKLEERPGMRALRELRILSPLRECGLTKEDIRQFSRELGLSIWDHPSYSCLATRIATGEPITAHKLHITEKAEDLLFKLGFKNFRVRLLGTTAKIQVTRDQLDRVLDLRETIISTLKNDYSSVLLDLEPRD